MSDRADPVAVLTAKLDAQVQACVASHRSVDASHRAIADRVDTLDRMLRGANGDGGLFSQLAVTQEKLVQMSGALKQVTRQMDVLSLKIEANTGRFWKLALLMAGLGGSAGGLTAKLLERIP